MVDERKRIPIDESYIRALGLAAYAFATCEWQVVWCCEKIKPGVLRKIVGDESTAGAIAKKFFNLVRNMPRSKEREQLAEIANEFLILVDVRNKIVHGKPCTAPSGAQRLSSGKIIEVQEIETAADRFAACGSKLNSHFHGFLKEYVPA